MRTSDLAEPCCSALGIGVLSTWDVAGPSSSKTIDGDPLKAVRGRAVEPPAGE